MKSVRIAVNGQVRGFGFRSRAAYLANILQLKGKISFTDESTLLIVIQGDETAIEKFITEISTWDLEAGFLEFYRENIVCEPCSDFVIMHDIISGPKTNGSLNENVKKIYSTFNNHCSHLMTKWQNFIK